MQALGSAFTNKFQNTTTLLTTKRSPISASPKAEETEVLISGSYHLRCNLRMRKPPELLASRTPEMQQSKSYHHNY